MDKLYDPYLDLGLARSVKPARGFTHEFDRAFFDRVNRVVRARPDADACCVMRAALAYDDAAWNRFLPVMQFDPKILGCRLAVVLCGASGFGMCHRK